MKKQSPNPQKPFFSRFLEPQELRRVDGGRPPVHTLKYPSDDDEDGATI